MSLWFTLLLSLICSISGITWYGSRRIYAQSSTSALCSDYVEVTFDFDDISDAVIINIVSSTSASWFSVGFPSPTLYYDKSKRKTDLMNGYALIYINGDISEHTIAATDNMVHTMTPHTAQNIIVDSLDTSGGTVSITLSRNLTTDDPNDFTFDLASYVDCDPFLMTIAIGDGLTHGTENSFGSSYLYLYDKALRSDMTEYNVIWNVSLTPNSDNYPDVPISVSLTMDPITSIVSVEVTDGPTGTSTQRAWALSFPDLADIAYYHPQNTDPIGMETDYAVFWGEPDLASDSMFCGPFTTLDKGTAFTEARVPVSGAECGVLLGDHTECWDALPNSQIHNTAYAEMDTTKYMTFDLPFKSCGFEFNPYEFQTCRPLTMVHVAVMERSVCVSDFASVSNGVHHNTDKVQIIDFQRPTHRPTISPSSSPTLLPTNPPSANTFAPSVSPTGNTAAPSFAPTVTPACIYNESYIYVTASAYPDYSGVYIRNLARGVLTENFENPFLPPHCGQATDGVYDGTYIYETRTEPRHYLWMYHDSNGNGLKIGDVEPCDPGNEAFLTISSETNAYLDGTNCVWSDIDTANGVHWKEKGGGIDISGTFTLCDASESCFTPLPTAYPTEDPTIQTGGPTEGPSHGPTGLPTGSPTMNPSAPPTANPTIAPSSSPTFTPTLSPTLDPTRYPTETLEPTALPTKTPLTVLQSYAPTQSPSLLPTVSPTDIPTKEPTNNPLHERQTLTTEPTELPTKNPLTVPRSYAPTLLPTASPTDIPTKGPTNNPLHERQTAEPTRYPTLSPISAPTTWQECIEERVESGDVYMQISITFNTASREVQIQLIAPINAWFGIGFGAHQMNKTLAVTVASIGGSMVARRRRLKHHLMGDTVSTTLDSIETMDASDRMVTIRHSWTMDGMFDFSDFLDGNECELPIIWAVGEGSVQLGHHGRNNRGSVTLWSCMCTADPNKSPTQIPTALPTDNPTATSQPTKAPIEDVMSDSTNVQWSFGTILVTVSTLFAL